ncbi:MAG: BamA/TamA family outer membrane protein [Bacteroidota bacterium]
MRYLKKDEVLLVKNKISIENSLKSDSKRSLNYELNNVVKQQPNRKFLGLFRTRLWLYNRTERDTTKKFRRWLHNKVGEPPVLYDSVSTTTTATTMQNYLNNKGYFVADVQPKTTIKKKKAVTNYHIDTRPIYSVDSLSYRIAQPDIDSIIKSNNEATLLQKGSPVDNNLFDSEKNRLTKLLRNNGYAYFYRNYIAYKSFDSTDYKVDVTTFIYPPEDSAVHETYQVGDIYIFPGFYPSSKNPVPFDTLEVDEYKFLYREKMGIKTKPLMNAIFLKKGNIFKQDDIDATNKKLGNLGIYKFVSIRFSKNKDEPNQVDFFIYLTPSKKLMLGFDFEINTANASALGTSININHRNRNIFKGAEIFSIGLEGGVEFGFSESQTLLNTLDIGTQFSLLFPKWIVPFKIKSNPRHSPKTRLTLEYDYQDRIQYYRNSLFSASFGYEWQPRPSIRHELTPISLNFLRINEVRERFQDILDNNPFLQNSFTDQFFLGGNYSFILTTPSFKNESSIYYRANAEVAGNSIGLMDRIIQPDFPFKPFDINYSQYLKVESDFRYYKSTGRKSSLASRIFIGVGMAYGNSDEVPYVKQYFAGGTTGMRAWRLRELGPGGYIDTLTQNDPTIQFYQAADFKLEANIEYRFDIISVVEGAIFLDAGNIWTLKEDNRGIEAKLTKDFYRQIALGTGFGLRLDFSYFIIRFDLAYKLRNPFPNEKGSYWNYSDKVFRFRDAALNLAVGYPF